MLTVWALLLFLAMWVRSTAGGSFRIGKSFGKIFNIICTCDIKKTYTLGRISSLLLYTLKLCLFEDFSSKQIAVKIYVRCLLVHITEKNTFQKCPVPVVQNSKCLLGLYAALIRSILPHYFAQD